MTVKLNLPNANSGGINNLVSEYIQFDYLFKLSPRSSSGNISFTSATSGIIYDTTNYLSGIYTNLGQEGMLMVLQDALKSYLITADDYNGINDSINNHTSLSSSETVSAHIKLATPTETTTGTDNTRAVHPLGLKSATNLLIPLTQKGVANGVATLNTLGVLSNTQLPLVSATGYFTDTTTSVLAGVTYTKTIPLGLTGKVGSLVLSTPTYGSYSMIDFDTVAAHARGIGTTPQSGTIVAMTDGYLGAACSSTYVLSLQNAYILGTNLILVFHNSDASTRNINVNVLWEVQ